MIRTWYTLILFICGLSTSSFAQDGYQINVNLDGYEKDTLVLGYYLGNNQYVRDTTIRNGNSFVFEGDTLLPEGMYIVIVPPLNDIIQLLIDDDQILDVSATYDKGIKDIEISGHEDNELYYEYVNYIKTKRPVSDSLKKQLDSMDVESEEYANAIRSLQIVDSLVESKTDEIIASAPDSYTALILKTNQQIQIPEFEGEEKDVQMKRFRYFKKHYFEKMYLDDSRMFRTPYLFERVNYYTDKLTMRDPDSISASVDQILESMSNNEQAFQYYLVHFLNKYAKSKIVGQDAVYVHLAEEYYAKGRAPWTDAEQLNKILKNARELKPTLLGETAPDLTLENRSGEKINIHSIEADFTVIYFWSPTCPHCKKSTPKLIEFYNSFKDRGVKVITVCGKLGKDTGTCWEYIDENEGMDIFYNFTDQYYKSKFKSVYYVKSTPKIYVLDKDKKIVSKGIGAEQLPELMEFLTEKKESK